MDNKKTHPIDLTDDQMKQLEEFAQEKGMSVDEAASFMASAELRARYTKPRNSGAVLPFTKRGG